MMRVFQLLVTLLTIVSALNNNLPHQKSKQFKKFQFIQDDLYDVSRKISEKCMITVTNTVVRSVTECAYICGDSADCIGFTWTNESQTCFYHTHCTRKTCNQKATADLVFFRKAKTSCKNGGILDKTSLTCNCVDHWVGDTCERLPYSCEDYFQHRYSEKRERNVNIDIYRNGSSINTFCYRINNGVYSRLFRADGKQDHNRSYSDYVYGYVINSQNFWYGLEHIKHICQGHNKVVWSAKCKLCGTTGKKLHDTVYKNLHVGHSSDGYPLTYDRMTQYDPQNPFVDCFEDIKRNSLKFSASDNEMSSAKCALRYGAGWWFADDCNTTCHPLGWSSLEPGKNPNQYMRLPNVDLSNITLAGSFERVDFMLEVLGSCF